MNENIVLFFLSKTKINYFIWENEEISEINYRKKLGTPIDKYVFEKRNNKISKGFNDLLGLPVFNFVKQIFYYFCFL